MTLDVLLSRTQGLVRIEQSHRLPKAKKRNDKSNLSILCDERLALIITKVKLIDCYSDEKEKSVYVGLFIRFCCNGQTFKLLLDLKTDLHQFCSLKNSGKDE